MQWCNSIISRSNLSVQTFVADFADGVVLCLILSFYFPNVLATEEINMQHIPGLGMLTATVKSYKP